MAREHRELFQTLPTPPRLLFRLGGVFCLLGITGKIIRIHAAIFEGEVTPHNAHATYTRCLMFRVATFCNGLRRPFFGVKGIEVILAIKHREF